MCSSVVKVASTPARCAPDDAQFAEFANGFSRPRHAFTERTLNLSSQGYHRRPECNHLFTIRSYSL